MPANIFFAHFVSLQIRDDRSQRVFLALMMSCAVHYDVIYHPSPFDSQYLKTWGVDSPVTLAGHVWEAVP